MNALICIAIMQIGTISNICVIGSLSFFGYHFVKYARVWWVTPSDQPVPFEFFKTRRKQAIVMAVILGIGLSLPSRNEAVAQYVGWKTANASIWDRLFANNATVDQTVDRIVEQIEKR